MHPDRPTPRKRSVVVGYDPQTMADFEPQEHFLRADLRLVKGARDFAEQAAEAFGLEDGARYQVRLAMSEAVTNAIQHGSSSPDDPIRIWAASEGGALVFEVLDTGHFRPRAARRGDSLPISGRGLEFLRILMDDVDVRPGSDGTLLRFTKRK
jgi:anti-sigma regulatory factor (Ser/Thr protein kinase)